MAQHKQIVESYIKENKVVVFSKTYCPYCKSTKQTLDDLGAKYLAVELDKRDDGSELQAALQEISNQRTVPNTFIGQKHIGGNSDLQALLKSGELQTLLKNAGALEA
ncbi:glutaredoxin [Sodiomyces alkalinus F11]|uniref:Glutaredoxin n=1 Tax=Sodiomyces alkalinus (strain CBS 110278 / VKM F-3762 / F11) TaxID=1314773 RepID=A0A3N2PJ04_SODAK|nr:glutaredoxin [Sodiomyces alkalinus F11]ROT34522.1 glutaredoxin [Sodiomyces alkalinus F11]